MASTLSTLIAQIAKPVRRRARSASSVTMPVSELTMSNSAATSMVQYQTLPESKPL